MTRPIHLVSFAASDGAYMPSGTWEYRMKRLPHLGLLSLAAVLKRAGRPYRVLDQSVHGFDVAGFVRAVREARPLFVGVYSTVTQRAVVCEALRALTRQVPEVPVVVGGPDRCRADLYLGAGAAAVAAGEGEETILDLARAFESSASLDSVAGLLLPGERGPVATAERGPIADLDALPFADRDALPIAAYHDHHVIGMRLPYATTMASRGCPYRCSFCDSPAIWGNRVRYRSPANVLAELEDLRDRYGVRYVGFKDDQFAVNPDWEERFLTTFAERRLGLAWSCLVHPYNFRRRRDEKLRRFRDAGCDLLSFGLQAVDPQVLRAIHRSAEEPAELAENVRVAKRLGITVAVHFIFGLPGESIANMNGAVAWARRVRPHYTVFFPLTVLEESELGQTLGERPPSELPGELIDAHVNKAYRSVYASPALLAQNLAHALRKNPRWLAIALAQLGYILRSTILNRVRYRVARTGAPASAIRRPTPAYLAPYG